MGVHQSSAEAYYSDKTQAAIGTEKVRVLDYLRSHGPSTRREIAADLHLERGSVSRTVCDLMAGEDSLVIELDGHRPCPITKRNVSWVCLRADAPWMQGSLLP